VGLGWLVNAYSSDSFHKAKEVGLQTTKGVGSKHIKGGRSDCKGLCVQDAKVIGFASKLGGIMEVAMWLCAPLLIGL
jgi:hypothetical protein